MLVYATFGSKGRDFSSRGLKAGGRDFDRGRRLFEREQDHEALLAQWAREGRLTVNTWKKFERSTLVNKAREIEVALNSDDSRRSKQHRRIQRLQKECLPG